MAFLYEWIKQIVLFILIGTVLEMLLPSNQLKKYVHFVFGLLLLLLLTKPIFYLFQTDITKEIMLIERQMEPNRQAVETTSFHIEKQKKDIQAEQAAYIWNELAQNFINEANKIMEQQYDLSISHVSFEEESINPLQISDFTKIYVTIVPFINEEHASFKQIEPIIIRPNETSTQPFETKREAEIVETLRMIWKLEDEVTIQIIWEGGTL